MKFDFTDGEWRYSAKFLNVFCIENQGNICKIDTERDLKEDIANARLISCAPEMLEASIKCHQLLCDACRIINPHHKDCNFCNDVKDIQNIIEKATGKKWEEICNHG